MVFEVTGTFVANINTIMLAMYRANVECKNLNLFVDGLIIWC